LAAQAAQVRATWLPMAMSLFERAVANEFKLLAKNMSMTVTGRNSYGETVAFEVPMDVSTLADEELNELVYGVVEDLAFVLMCVEEKRAEEDRKDALVRSAKSKLSAEELKELTNTLTANASRGR